MTKKKSTTNQSKDQSDSTSSDSTSKVKDFLQNFNGETLSKIIVAVPVLWFLPNIMLQYLGHSDLSSYLANHQLTSYVVQINQYIDSNNLAVAMMKNLLYFAFAAIALLVSNILLYKCYNSDKQAMLSQHFIYPAVLFAATFITGLLLLYINTDWFYKVLGLAWVLLLIANIILYIRTKNVAALCLGSTALLLALYMYFIFSLISLHTPLTLSFWMVLFIAVALMFSSGVLMTTRVYLHAPTLYNSTAALFWVVIDFSCAVGILVFVATLGESYTDVPKDLGIGGYYESVYLRGDLKTFASPYICNNNNKTNKKVVNTCYQAYVNKDIIKVWVILQTNQLLVIAPHKGARYSMVFYKNPYVYVTTLDAKNMLNTSDQSN